MLFDAGTHSCDANAGMDAMSCGIVLSASINYQSGHIYLEIISFPIFCHFWGNFN